jgi:hypothetical protein
MTICAACGEYFINEDLTKPQGFCPECRKQRKKAPGGGYSGPRSGGKRADLDNRYFRSQWEANYARYLNFLIANKCDMASWEYEAEEFEFTKITHGTRFYKPDFKVTYLDGHVEYHEVKGWDYAKGVTARKRMAKYYPLIKIVLIDEQFFKEITRKHLDRLIPGWEHKK